MNVYFTASIVGKKHHLANYQRIITALKSRNGIVQCDHIMNNTESTIRLETKSDRLAFHQKLEQWINTSDCMVVEATFPSISVGYEISLALNRGKPVLILYSEGDPPSLFADHSNEKLVCEKYSIETLPTIIDDFLNFAQGNADMRFTFFITSAIAAYLTAVSKREKIPKSVYIRHLIETDMKR